MGITFGNYVGLLRRNVRNSHPRIQTTNNTDNKCIYKLISFTIHLGNTIQSGHYVNLRKINNNWIMFDDNKVSTIKLNNIDTTCAYYMIYKK